MGEYLPQQAVRRDGPCSRAFTHGCLPFRDRRVRAFTRGGLTIRRAHIRAIGSCGLRVRHQRFEPACGPDHRHLRAHRSDIESYA
jgi:hypothetical protein